MYAFVKIIVRMTCCYWIKEGFDENTTADECQDKDENTTADECQDKDENTTADECQDKDENTTADECQDKDEKCIVSDFIVPSVEFPESCLASVSMSQLILYIFWQQLFK